MYALCISIGASHPTSTWQILSFALLGVADNPCSCCVYAPLGTKRTKLIVLVLGRALTWPHWSLSIDCSDVISVLPLLATFWLAYFLRCMIRSLSAMSSCTSASCGRGGPWPNSDGGGGIGGGASQGMLEPFLESQLDLRIAHAVTAHA